MTRAVADRLRSWAWLGVVAALACATDARRLVYVGSRDGGYRPLAADVHACPPGSWPFAQEALGHLDHLCIQPTESSSAIRQGRGVRFDSEGRVLYDGQYEDGFRSGAWTVYRDDGSVYHTLRYLRGKITSLRCP